MNFKRFILFNLKRLFLVSLLSTIVLLYLIPYSLYKTVADKKVFAIEEITGNTSLLTSENSFVFVLITLIIIVCSVLLTFRYIHLDKVRANIIRNSLSRKKIFWGNTLSSYIISVIPCVVTFLVTLFIPLENIFSKWYIIIWNFKFLLMHLSIFATAVFITSTVRTSVVQAVFIFVCLSIPLLIENVFSNTVEILLNGFVADLGMFGKILRGFPIFTFVTNNYNFGIIKIIGTLVVSAGLVVASAYIYIKKPSVATRGYIRYKKLREVYRILFFLFFALISLVTAKKYLFIILLCALINIILCELILYGEIKINKKQKIYLIYAAVFILFYSVMRFDMLNIKDKDIFIDEVSEIYVGSNYYNIDNLLNIADNEIVYDFNNIGVREFEKLDADKINRFINYHNIIKENTDYDNRDLSNIFIAYKLKNDEIIIRKYRFDYRKFLEDYKQKNGV